MGKRSPSSDASFRAIELTAAEVDRLTELLGGMSKQLNSIEATLNQTAKNVQVLRSQQDVMTEDLASYQEKLNRINRRFDDLGELMDLIRSHVPGLRVAYDALKSKQKKVGGK